MSGTGPLGERIDELEIRIAHQDRAIEDLNATITAQWKEIETLMLELRRLRERVQEMDDASIPALPESPPPHY